jgi:hypothetical protein
MKWVSESSVPFASASITLPVGKIVRLTYAKQKKSSKK